MGRRGWPLEAFMGDVVGRSSSRVERIDGRVDGDEGSVARRRDLSTQSLVIIQYFAVG